MRIRTTVFKQDWPLAQETEGSHFCFPTPLLTRLKPPLLSPLSSGSAVGGAERLFADGGAWVCRLGMLTSGATKLAV